MLGKFNYLVYIEEGKNHFEIYAFLISFTKINKNLQQL